MNKQQFIEYIDKLPNEIDFTPMTVDLKAECPNPDGSYRTITKKIKFECTYTEMVHKLPTSLNGGASLFFTVFTRVRFQTVSSPSFIAFMRLISSRIEA